MAVVRLRPEHVFPPATDADDDGLLAVGGDVHPERLLVAYSRGIFPWPHQGLPLLWFSPNPRWVLIPSRAHVPRSLQKTIRRGTYEIRFDTAFAEVVAGCATTPRPRQRGTWITPALAKSFAALHERGIAHSIEAWHEGELVGGVYGLALGRIFFGESMFARMADASKVAFVALIDRLREWEFALIDCQVQTDHLDRFGAEPWSRLQFLATVAEAVEQPGRPGSWRVIDHAQPAR